MPSFRSRLFVFMLKHRHILKFQFKRRTKIFNNTSLKDLREEVEKGAEFFGKLPKELSLEPFKIDSLEAEWMIPNGVKKDKAILYFHGGGLVVGSIRAHRGIVAKFVKDSNVPALVINYGLAPEDPYPKALNDGVAAYKYLLDQGIDPKKIVFMGDSGGGNLVFSTVHALKKEGIQLPGGLIALSPWTDLTNSGDSWKDNAELDTLCWKEAQVFFSEYYATNNDPKDPMISPLFGDFEGFPPILLYAGGHELMLSDSVRLADKAKKAGVNVTLNIGQGLFHCYPACSPIFPEATNAKDEICDFIKDKTAP